MKNGSYEHRDSIVSQKKILQFSSHTFGYYSHFFEPRFWCILTFTIWVLSNIYFYQELWGKNSVSCEAPRIASIAHVAAFLANTKRIGIETNVEPRKKATRSPFVTSFSLALTTVLNVEERVRTSDLLPYDTYSTTMLCDNSANVHIYNKRNMFVGDIRKCTNQGVATIGDKGNQPSVIVPYSTDSSND